MTEGLAFEKCALNVMSMTYWGLILRQAQDDGLGIARGQPYSALTAPSTSLRARLAAAATEGCRTGSCERVILLNFGFVGHKLPL